MSTLQADIKSRRATQRFGLVQKLAIAAASAVAMVAVIEIGARLLGWGQIVLFVPSDEWGFLMRPSQTVYTYGQPVMINALGLRGPELKEPKPPGSKRLVFVGDSVTYGGGRIAEEQLSCRIVEARARAAGFDVEVVNLSAPAWSPQNWWGYINKHGLYDADLVVLVLPECDLTRVFSNMEIAGHTAQAPLLRLQSVLAKVVARFKDERLTARQDADEVIAANLSAVRQLKETCSGIRFLAVLVPSGVPRKLNEELWKDFIPCLLDVVDLRTDLQDPSLFVDGFHLNARGHAFVAEKLLERVRPLLAGMNNDAGRASSP